MSGDKLVGNDIIQALDRCAVEFVVALPDIVTCDGVLWPLSKDDRFRVVMVCKEDEGVSICAALSYVDKRAVLMMQHTGFLDSINAIRALCCDYGLPVVMLVGLQGMEPDRQPAESKHKGIRMLQPILAAMDIPCTVVDERSSSDDIAGFIESAYEEPRAAVMLIARSPA